MEEKDEAAGGSRAQTATLLGRFGFMLKSIGIHGRHISPHPQHKVDGLCSLEIRLAAVESGLNRKAKGQGDPVGGARFLGR